MALSPYTSAAEVRALLGVSDVELPDSTLGLAVYEVGLRREILKISASLPADFLTVSGIGAGSRTTVQADLYDTTVLFSAYAAARQVGSALGLVAPKSLTDDKSGFDRFADAPYRDVLARLEQQYQAARAALVKAVAAYAGQSPSGTLDLPAGLSAASPTYDPVVGDEAG